MPVILQSRRASASAPVWQAGAEPWLCDCGLLDGAGQTLEKLGIDAEQGCEQQDDAAADPAADHWAAAHPATVLDL